MAIIKRSTSGGASYLVRVRDADGTWFPSKTFPTKQEAKNYESELSLRRSHGARSLSRSIRDRLFSEYWEEWSTTCRTNVSDGWKLSQDQMWRDHVAPVLGHRNLVEISKPEILRLLNYCKGKDLGPQMQLHVFRLVHKMFGDAVEVFEYLESNPVRKSMRPQVPQTERAFLKPDQAREFLAAVRKSGDFLAPAIWTMTYCALRAAEARALLWGDLDLDSGVMTVSRQANYKEKRITPLKNRTIHRVPMPEPLVEYLGEIRGAPEAFVSPGADGKSLLSYNTLEDGLKRLCARFKMPTLSPHELRHSATELWVELGASEEDIRRLLNHSGLGSVKRYIHATPERLNRLARAFVRKGERPRLIAARE